MTPAAPSRTPARVLILDDDSETRLVMVEWLERAGYTCTATASFDEASALLLSRQVDLLITDIRLGDYNGIHFVYRHAGEVPAIVITGFNDPALAAEVRAQGAIYLLKPIDPTTLLGYMRAMLADRG